MTTTAASPDRLEVVADRFVAFLETGQVSAGLFAPDVFLDYTRPLWRVQTQGIDDAVTLRRRSHPEPGRVPRHRLDATPTGFVLEVEEVWEADGDHWYCRELFRADVGPDGITQLTVFCTGNWDSARVAEHAAQVRLLRP